MAVGKSELQILINAKDNASKTLGKATKALNLVGVAAIGVAGASIKMAADFDKGMREVATLTPEVADNLDAIKQDVLDLSKSLGIDAVEATGALYQAISAGVPTDNAISFLQIASKAAIGGVTDTQTSVDGLTTVMNAFAGENISAQKAADVLFATVKAGKTDFAQLSGALFNVAPLANAAGVSFEEISAAMATITAQGTPTSVATTQLRAAIQGLIKPSDDLTQIFRRQGFESGELAVQQLGLAGAADIVRDATGGSISEMQALLGSMEGVSAILGITGDNAEAFAGNVKNMGEAGGAAQKAFEEMEKSTSRQFEKMTNQAKIMGIELGTKLLPHVNKLLGFITDMNPQLRDNIAKFGVLVGVLGLMSIALKPVVASFQVLATTMVFMNRTAIPGVIAGFAKVTAAGLATAFTVAAVVAAVALLVIGVAKIGELFGWWGKLSDGLGDTFSNLGSTIQGMTQGITDAIGITTSAGQAVELYSDQVDGASEAFAANATATGVAMDATRELTIAQVEAEDAAQRARAAEEELAAARAAHVDAIDAAEEALRNLNVENEISDRIFDTLAKATMPTVNEQLEILYVGLVNAGLSVGDATAEVMALERSLKNAQNELYYSTIATEDFNDAIGDLDEGINGVGTATEKTDRSIRRYAGGLSEAEKATRRLNRATSDIQFALESIGLEAEVLDQAYRELAGVGIEQAKEGFELLEATIRQWGEESGKSVDGFIEKLDGLKNANERVIASQEAQVEATKVVAQAQRDAERATEAATRETHKAATEAARAADQPLPRPPVSVSDAQTIAQRRMERQLKFGVFGDPASAKARADAEKKRDEAMTAIRGLSAAQRMQFAEGTLGGVNFGQGFDFGFQRGGAFTVPGSGGPDSQLVSFAATPGERVSVTRPGQAGGGIQQTIIVQGSIVTERQLSSIAVQAMRDATRLNQSVLNVNAVVA
jgi:TP901 family phage tail tape measure protein